MFDSSMFIALLQTPNVQSFLISLAAGVVWDGAKKTASRSAEKESPIEQQLAEIITDTMREFYDNSIYGFNGETWQETIVMQEFYSQYRKQVLEHGGVADSGALRFILDETIYPGLTDAQYSRWIDILIKNCSANPTICRWSAMRDGKSGLFIDSNSTLQRMEAKLRNYLEEVENESPGRSDSRFDPVLDNLNREFCSSWKRPLLDSADKLLRNIHGPKAIEDKLAFIRSNEDCGDVLALFKEILSLCRSENAGRQEENRLRDLIRHTSFNKVLVIAGTTGAGKSFFTYQYVQNGLRLLREGRAEIIPCVIDCGGLRNTSRFEQEVLQQLGEFLGTVLPSLDAAHERLESLRAKICFVADNIHAIIDQASDWRNIAAGIKNFSRYETFKWILTINSYDYYMLEESPEFLRQYCVKLKGILGDDSGKSKICGYALDVDALNQNWGVVKQILAEQYKISVSEDEYRDIRQGISTPLEAIYFGECAKGKLLVSFPSTYEGFVNHIVSWKSEALADHGPAEIQQALLKIVDFVVKRKSCTIQAGDAPESDLNAFRHVQLLSKTEEKTADIFSAAQSFPSISYHLRVLPFWAAKIVGERFRADALPMGQLFSFPPELKEWLIPCYIFLKFKQEDKWGGLFSALKNQEFLEYALFCAQRSSPEFCGALYKFLRQNEECISSDRSCYAVMYFVYHCPLKMSEKFHLLRMIAGRVGEYSLTNIYEKVFNFIADTASKSKNLKKNMLVFTTCSEEDINFILGYGCARVFMHLAVQEGRNFDLILWDVINYIDSHGIIHQITLEGGHNYSFMDFFIRKCFEEHICSSELPLEAIYQHMEQKFFPLKYPIGSYIRRNLTCAAGNIFSSRKEAFSGYDAQYMKLAGTFAQSSEGQKKETAYFLIKNSLSKDGPPLEPALEKILLDIKTHRKIRPLYNRDCRLFGLE